MTDLFGLRPYQAKAVDEIEAAWRSGIKSICLQLPTGGGKTRILRQIVDNHAAGKKIIYIVAHRKNLVGQLSRELTEGGIMHGIIAAGSPYIKYRVQVCSVQTMIRRLDDLPEPALIVIDEVHHSRSETYRKLLDRWPGILLLGVTATPRRGDGKPLRSVAQHLICGPSTRELMDMNFLSEYDYFAPETISMEGVHVKAGEYVASEVSARVDTKAVIGSAVEHYRSHADRTPAIVACVRVDHAEHVAQGFREAGYRAVAIHSGIDEAEINRAIRGLGDGSVDLLCNCGLISEGTDIPAATTLIWQYATFSEVIYLQYVGRVLRKHKDKEGAIILDHCGNWEMHGLPDDPREWSLDTQENKQEGSSLKRCPGCERPVKKTERQCPYCGYLWAEREGRGSRDLPQEKDGKLVQITSRGRGELITEIARRARTLQQAVKIAAEFGQDQRAAYGVWVNVLKNKPGQVIFL